MTVKIITLIAATITIIQLIKAFERENTTNVISHSFVLFVLALLGRIYL